jgi:beta-galactosidase
MRIRSRINQGWLWSPTDAGPTPPPDDFTAVTLPHTHTVVPHHNFDPSAYTFVSTYRKQLTLPEELNGRRIYIDFDGVMIAHTVTINGHTFPEYRGGYTPAAYDITDHWQPDGENWLAVRVDGTERPDIPPFGYTVDYLTFAGIYRDVWLRMVAPCHIKGVFVQPQTVLTAPTVKATAYLTNASDTPFTGEIRTTLLDADGSELAYTISKCKVRAGQEVAQSALMADLPAIDLWSLDNPALYHMRFDLLDGNGNITDSYMQRFGFREAQFNKDGSFYLNGEPLNLFGLNRHQTYPYIGAAAPERLQRKDADIVKYELGCNIVRTSHYPQSPHFMRRCDEIGLLVFDEIPGWQHIGDADWQQLVVRDVVAMIERDRNHPSVIIWGVRVNESLDNDALYEETNTLAHDLDPSRQTGGVRYFQESRLLEDVFTFNDFSGGVVEPLNTPHLITEFNGHMFPTKIYDHEERLVEHALRHARIHDAQMGHDKIAGGIGWCAFDYNTHRQFGSGDRICYHGVMDIFRLPKYAAHFYASQVDPTQRVVLQPATLWSVGDRDASRIDPLVVFSNCDEIEIFIGEQSFGRHQPDRASFPNLPHPPFQITLFADTETWGQQLADLHVYGYINGQQVAERHYITGGLPHHLILQADDSELHADGADMTRVMCRVADEVGNRVPYSNTIVTFTIDGPGDLIGENPLMLPGGQAAVYVKAPPIAGIITVTASAPGLGSVSVRVSCIRP